MCGSMGGVRVDGRQYGEAIREIMDKNVNRLLSKIQYLVIPCKSSVTLRQLPIIEYYYACGLAMQSLTSPA